MGNPVNTPWESRNDGNFPTVNGPIQVRALAYASFPAATSLPAGTMLSASDQSYALYVTDGADWVAVGGSSGGTVSTLRWADYLKFFGLGDGGAGNYNVASSFMVQQSSTVLGVSYLWDGSDDKTGVMSLWHPDGSQLETVNVTLHAGTDGAFTALFNTPYVIPPELAYYRFHVSMWINDGSYFLYYHQSKMLGRRGALLAPGVAMIDPYVIRAGYGFPNVVGDPEAAAAVGPLVTVP